MTVENAKSISLPVTGKLMDAVRGWLQGQPEVPFHDHNTSAARVSKRFKEKDSYARLLEDELGTRPLSDAEKEGSDDLARIRAALYAKD